MKTWKYLKWWARKLWFDQTLHMFFLFCFCLFLFLIFKNTHWHWKIKFGFLWSYTWIFPIIFFNKSRSKLASPLILRRFFPDGFLPTGLSQKWKREENGEESAKGKGRREWSLSPQSPHSYPFSAQHPATFDACYVGCHRRVYSSVKSLLAGATLFGQRPRSSRCSSVQFVYFGSIKRENYLFMASTVKTCWKLKLSEGWKCYFRDPVFQNLPGEHAPGPP